MTEILNCLPRPPSRRKCRKMSWPKNRMARVDFAPRLCRSQSRRSNHLTTLPKTYSICFILCVLEKNNLVLTCLGVLASSFKFHSCPLNKNIKKTNNKSSTEQSYVCIFGLIKDGCPQYNATDVVKIFSF